MVPYSVGRFSRDQEFCRAPDLPPVAETRRCKTSAMHEVDQTTEQMVRSVLAYGENRLRMNPAPLDGGVLGAQELYNRLDGVIRETPRPPDEVLGVYTSVFAPSLITADSPRF